MPQQLNWTLAQDGQQQLRDDENVLKATVDKVGNSYVARRGEEVTATSVDPWDARNKVDYAITSERSPSHTYIDTSRDVWKLDKAVIVERISQLQPEPWGQGTLKAANLDKALEVVDHKIATGYTKQDYAVVAQQFEAAAAGVSVGQGSNRLAELQATAQSLRQSIAELSVAHPSVNQALSQSIGQEKQMNSYGVGV